MRDGPERLIARGVVPALLSLCLVLGLARRPCHADDLALPLRDVGPGKIRLMYAADSSDEPTRVARFRLMTRAVTNREFLSFTTQHPRWRRGSVTALYADSGYLSHWADPLTLGPGARPDQPVVRVSWFASKAFCQAYGLRLPTESEWELAAAASERRADARRDPAFRARVLKWYSRPLAELPDVPFGPANLYKLHDLHGVVWEWVYDFNNNVLRSDSRDQADGDSTEFCGAASLGASDTGDYASFMRYAFRSSLQANFTASSLGFRCAGDVADDPPNHTTRPDLRTREP